jgi:pilus assembly protein CpaB
LMVGERITTESLKWQDWPEAGAANVAFFVQSKAPDSIKAFENGVVRQEMVSGEPVTAKKIVAVDAATSSMAALLTPGMRATSVVITPDSSVAGFVLPNDRVDVVLRTCEFWPSINQLHKSKIKKRSQALQPPLS